jgi:transcriptional regulator of acetoin/glycerol metabolism
MGAGQGQVSLIAHDWPGNVRELSNTIERGLALSDDDVFRLTGELSGLTHSCRDDSLLLCDVERNHILRVLDRVRWVINGPKGATRLLGLHPNTLRNRMNKLGICRKVSLAAA